MVPMLMHLDRDRFKPRVCVLQDHHGNPVAGDIRALGIPVDMLPVIHLRDLTAIPRIMKYLLRHQADLIHTQLEFSDILGNTISWLMRLPSVCTIHTSPTPEKHLTSRARQRLSWACQRRFCDVVISVSEIIRNYYLSASGNSSSKVMTIHNGIDLSNYETCDKYEQNKIRQDLGIPPQAPILITVAMLRPEKGIQFLIEALPAILKAIPDLYYLVAGRGEYLDALLEKAAKMKVTEHIVFAGMRRDIPALLSISDLFVLPTLTEALPTVLAEAMAAHKPVIASKVGGVPEMINDHENGLLISPANPKELAEACVALLKDRGKMKKMGACGWNIANERFNILRQTQRLKTVYEDLLHAYER